MVSIKELENEYQTHTLTEYLKKCSMSDLQTYYTLVLCDDIVGIRVGIYDAILTEIEYRSIRSNFPIDTNEDAILSTIEYYRDDFKELDYRTIKQSMDFYNGNNIDYHDNILWFPAGVSIKMCYCIYKFMKENGFNEEDIKRVMLGNLSQTNSLYNSLTKRGFDYNLDNNDKEFVLFIKEVLGALKEDKSETESFKKIYGKVSTKYDELLSRLK